MTTKRIGPLLVVPILLLVASSMDRLGFLSAAPPAQGPTDAAFLAHPALGALHVIGGLAMILLGPLQLVASLRRRRPALHRWAGRAFVVTGLATGATGLVMNVVFPPVGGLPKLAVLYLMSAGMIAAIVVGLRAILRGDVATHRTWMARAFGIALSAGTTAVLLVPWFVLAGPPSDAVLGLSRWVGLLVTMAIVELVVRGGWHWRATVPRAPGDDPRLAL